MLERIVPTGARPTGWRRWLLRFPLLLHRIGLGRLLGTRFAVIVNRGRKTGRVHQTAVEVVRYDAARDEIAVASGWGPAAAWYQNLRAAPALEVWFAGRRFHPQQRFLEQDDVVAAMRDYARRHPRAARALGSWMLGRRFDGSEEALRDFAIRIPMVAFRPRADDGMAE